MRDKRRNLESPLNTLTSEKGILIIVLSSLSVLFFYPLLNIYDKVIVNPILSKIEKAWINDVVFLLLTFLAILITVHLCKNRKRISSNIFFTFVAIFLLFLYFRILNDRYSFKKFYFFDAIAYADYFIVILASFVLLRVKSQNDRKLEPVYFDSPFLIDVPYQPGNRDLFGRKIFAKKIADKIQSKINLENAGSLAIGINGLWGSGKTSFMNMVDDEIDPKNRVIIHFHPWRSSKSENIVEDFFDLLIKKIRNWEPSLSNKIADYARTLTRIDESVLSRGIEFVASVIYGDINKSKAYKRINDSLVDFKKQIVVFIDDLDRLDKKEVIEVLRIIRNTANFNNVVYIVSYDQSYVEMAIKDFNPHRYQAFLEKIFQFQFSLPLYESGILRTELKKILKAELDNKFCEEIDRVIESTEFSPTNLTAEILRSYRDVIRFANSFLFEIATVQENVFFFDFYLLQLLKLKYPKVHQSIIDYRGNFFIDNGSGKHRLKTEKEAWDTFDPRYQILFSGIKEKAKEEESAKTFFETFLLSKASEWDLDHRDQELIKMLIDTLLVLKDSKNNFIGPFSHTQPVFANQDTQLYKSFCYTINFHKYFAFAIYEGDIDAAEFEKYRRKPIESYKLKVQEWIEEGKYSVLTDRLQKINDFTAIQQFENHVQILIEIGKHEIKNSDMSPLLFDYSPVLEALSYPIQSDRTVLYEREEDYRSFLLNLFKNAPRPAVFESSIVAALMRNQTRIMISLQELSDINYKYLEEYSQTHSVITNDFRQLHSNAILATANNNGKFEIRSDADTIFKKYFRENLRGCELSGFIKHSQPESDDFHIDQEWLKTFFPEMADFENYLRKSQKVKKETECYNEFMQFYKLAKMNGYEPVEYVFKHLKPSLWTGGTKTNPTRR